MTADVNLKLNLSTHCVIISSQVQLLGLKIEFIFLGRRDGRSRDLQDV